MLEFAGINPSNVSTGLFDPGCVAFRSNGKPIGFRSGYSSSKSPQKLTASLQPCLWPSVVRLLRGTMSSAAFVTITNKSNVTPLVDPRGINMCWGHPQPQTACWPVIWFLSWGKIASRSRKVCGQGMVREDSVDCLVKTFLPRWTVEIFRINLNSIKFYNMIAYGSQWTCPVRRRASSARGRWIAVHWHCSWAPKKYAQCLELVNWSCL